MGRHFIIRILTSICFLAGFAHGASAQTNVIYTTNWVPAAPNFRVVNNLIYDTTNSLLWTNISGRVLFTDHGVVVVENNLVNHVTTNLPQRLAIRNFRGAAPEGSRVATLAMRVGTFTSGVTNFPLWDCGTNALLPVIKTNEVGPLDRQAIKKDRL
jgi:hypothetical protein